MKVYKANRKGPINYILISAFILPFLIFFLDKSTFAEKPFILLTLLIPIILILWIYFDTYYQIENDKLKYKSGFIKGEIDVREISKIIKEKTMWSGIKPALAKKGLIIKYNRYDEIYIAPESNNEVVKHLLTINKNIEIVE